MEKPDVSGILEKVKSGAGDLAEKARIRTAEAAGSAGLFICRTSSHPGSRIGRPFRQCRRNDTLPDCRRQPFRQRKDAGGKIPEGTR